MKEEHTHRLFELILAHAEGANIKKPIEVFREVNAIEIPENATNGDVLCILFPNMHYTLSEKSPRVVTTIGVASSFDMDWWNAPYQRKTE